MAIYSLLLKVQGASTAAYYSASINDGAMSNGAGSVQPNSATYTYFGTYSNLLQMSVAPGTANISAMLVTDSNTVSGQVIASPAVNVPVVLSLYGAGKTLGTYTLQPGQTSGNYSFDVSSADSLTEEQARQLTEQHVPRKQ
jgi:hypothetical protein